ncbi:alpha/beta-hydrolase family protein [Nocardia sp. CDC153]|uniref:alpha/beta-hydrolase family protein n=1 Tax=Nocardia sp. CDC153 TaxID=3112167 RepID=UPI002DB9D5D6|nr:alpha/beta-hydrolase family protein [Nocardia sp. CDC153]MEC3954610.1 alpha/beta-hydrolase family protein [Nocardia sp. CDC153]
MTLTAPPTSAQVTASGSDGLETATTDALKHAKPHRDERGSRIRFGWARFRVPSAGTSIAVAGGIIVSLAPGLLPRTPSAQGILTALVVLIALTLAAVVRMLLRWTRFGIARVPHGRTAALVVSILLVGVAMGYAEHWQNELRTAMGVGGIGPRYWVEWLLWTVPLVGVFVGLARGVRWAVRRLGRARSVAAGVAVLVAGQLVIVPSIVEWRQRAYAAANSYVDPALVQPDSPTRSGSPVSMASWPSLGAQGRKFVAGTSGRAVRVYVGLNSAPDLDARVALAIRELERTGGFQRRNLVVAVPTGSGWIDSDAAKGLDARFGGDVALVGLQYSDAPSWVTFVFGRSAAEESARALFRAVEQRISALPDPPKLYIYGQSLGALGGSSVFTDDADEDSRTCGALWAGPPAGDVHHGRAAILANASDPVVRWSPSLLWRAPDLTGTRPDAPVPPWIPVVSFLQTTADLLGALDAPSGHGHRYGTDQGTVLPGC